jgi:hypothetical protein
MMVVGSWSIARKLEGKDAESAGLRCVMKPFRLVGIEPPIKSERLFCLQRGFEGLKHSRLKIAKRLVTRRINAQSCAL